MNNTARNYFINSVDIYDTLMAKSKQLTKSIIMDIAQKKGFLISKDDTREELATFAASLPFDYDDIGALYDLIEQDQHRDKVTSSTVKKKIAFENLKVAIDRVNEERAPYGEVLTILSDPRDGKIAVQASYVDTNFGKARMLQHTKREARIEFGATQNATHVRLPANEKCAKILSSIVKAIEESTGDTLEMEKVELRNITKPAKRNDFFFGLLNSVAGMPLQNILSVKMVPMPISADNDSDEVDTETSEEEVVIEGPRITGLIKRVAIEGDAVHGTREYQSLVEKGFFIANISWQAIDTNAKPSLMVELEAGFADQTECKGFKYAVKGIYNQEKDSGDFSFRRKAADDLTKRKYLTLIEKAAKTSFDGLTSDQD